MSRIYFDPILLPDGERAVRATIIEYEASGAESARVSHIMTQSGAWRRHSDFIDAIGASEDGHYVDDSLTAEAVLGYPPENHPNGLAF